MIRAGFIVRPASWSTERERLRAMIAGGCATFVECGPGKVLTSLNRRIERKPELKMFALEDGASIAAALAACTEAAS